MSIGNLFFSLKGRIGRTRFWLGNIAILAVCIAIDWLLGVPLTSDPTTLHARIIDLGVSVLAAYPMAAIGVKRLHDRNESGSKIWLFVAACAVAQVGSFFGYFDATGEETFRVWLAAAFVTVVVLSYLIYLGFRVGTDGVNDYGPPPQR